MPKRENNIKRSLLQGGINIQFGLLTHQLGRGKQFRKSKNT